MKNILHHKILNPKIIIIGGGPASTAAAIQLARSNVKIAIITENIGGLTLNAHRIENLIGYPQGISGIKLAKLMKRHLTRHQVPIVFEKVINLARSNVNPIAHFVINTQHHELKAPYVIVGSGTQANRLNIPGEDKAINEHRLYYEVYKLKKNIEQLEQRDIVIIGSGDAAYDYSLNLQDDANSLTILQRSSSVKCLPLLYDRVKQISNIRIQKCVEVTQIEPTEKKLQLTLESSFKSNSNKKVQVLETDYVLVAIGRRPCIDFMSQKLQTAFYRNKRVKRLYFVGDMIKKHYRQVSIASGDGLYAAMQLIEEINDENSR